MASNEELRRRLQAIGVNVPGPTKPEFPASFSGSKPAARYSPRSSSRKPSTARRKPKTGDVTISGNRPRPPASTGPIVSPQGETRAYVAAQKGYSDKARTELSRVPIRYSAKPAPGYTAGWYAPLERSIGINTETEGGYNPPTDTLAHEFTHYWDDTYGPRDEESYKQKVRDFHSGAENNPAMASGVKSWMDVSNSYEPITFGTWADELSARTSEYALPNNLPRDIVEKYYPGLYRWGPQPTQNEPIPTWWQIMMNPWVRNW